ncbi:hypothetical protein [Kitasatospora aureofaciens]|uniref:hypothetical protein n=1 Tax=Kitasatospora aureofaciens TaxID=1894 RepID=UPI003F4D589E
MGDEYAAARARIDLGHRLLRAGRVDAAPSPRGGRRASPGLRHRSGRRLPPVRAPAGHLGLRRRHPRGRAQIDCARGAGGCRRGGRAAGPCRSTGLPPGSVRRAGRGAHRVGRGGDRHTQALHRLPAAAERGQRDLPAFGFAPGDPGASAAGPGHGGTGGGLHSRHARDRGPGHWGPGGTDRRGGRSGEGGTADPALGSGSLTPKADPMPSEYGPPPPTPRRHPAPRGCPQTSPPHRPPPLRPSTWRTGSR